MPENKPQVYEGDRPYVFVSYAHADGAAMSIIRALAEEGYRVWYDDGIQAGSSFPAYIADRLFGCSCVLMLVSRSSLTSGWCRSEVEYALDLGRPVLPVYLEKVEMPRALQMRLGAVQALYWYSYATDEEFNEKLFAVRMLDPCLTPEGRRRRGVQPRDSRSEEPMRRTRAQVVEAPVIHPGASRPSDVNGVAAGVTPKVSLAVYSWTDLKAIAQLIAAAEDDAKGLAIARAYNLVDAQFQLLGDVKKVELDGGTEAHVRILGFRHDYLADWKKAGWKKAGISFGFSDVPFMREMNNGKETNMGGWQGSAMRKWLNETFINFLPNELKDNVVEVMKWTNNTGQLSSWCIANDVVTSTPDKLWLLSMVEIFGRLSSQRRNVPGSDFLKFYDIEGEQYKLYEDKRISTSNYDFCRKDGVSVIWWLRSPHASCGVDFHFIDEQGIWNDWWSYAKKPLGVSPGFCF